jgi:hypothetical protein
MGFGSGLKIICPENLRQEIKENIRKRMEFYNQKKFQCKFQWQFQHQIQWQNSIIASSTKNGLLLTKKPTPQNSLLFTPTSLFRILFSIFFPLFSTLSQKLLILAKNLHYGRKKQTGFRSVASESISTSSTV